jgi:ubiquinone biosynthesis monooxygenase Coq7
MTMRKLSKLDSFLGNADQMLRTVSGNTQHAQRPTPSSNITVTTNTQGMSQQKRKHIAALMRINHTGEVCAQALYKGQALAARSGELKSSMEQAANEEIDHLVWCEQRIKELDDHVSYLNPLWYAMSFSIGALAGAMGDTWSLGFVKETEDQVCKHLEEHLDQIPLEDSATRSILVQMKEDEAKHATMAKEEGARELPPAVKNTMSLVSKVMTRSTYYV